MIVIVIDILSILFLLLVLLWVFVPLIYGRPSIPTTPRRIRKALELVDLQPNQVLYDLGAGDGRVLLIARREFGARSIGIEAGLLQCAWIRLRLVAGGLGDGVQIRWANLYKASIRAADVIFIYPASKEVVKLASYLEKQLKPGARVVSISTDFPEWEPAAYNEGDLIFVYDMPPTKGNMMSYLLKKAK